MPCHKSKVTISATLGTHLGYNRMEDKYHNISAEIKCLSVIMFQEHELKHSEQRRITLVIGISAESAYICVETFQ